MKDLVSLGIRCRGVRILFCMALHEFLQVELAFGRFHGCRFRGPASKELAVGSANLELDFCDKSSLGMEHVLVIKCGIVAQANEKNVDGSAPKQIASASTFMTAFVVPVRREPTRCSSGSGFQFALER